MRTTIILIALIYSAFIWAEGKEKLFYFTNKQDGMFYVGVRDEAGKVILPAEIKNVQGFEDGDVVKDKLLSFYGCPKNIRLEKNACGCVFNLKGDFLYQSFFYDNGPDYRVEGYQRIIKDGKIGFADRHGNIVIQPQYDFVTPFQYGYAEFCRGCSLSRQQQNQVMVKKFGVVNFRGEEVHPSRVSRARDNLNIEGAYYPYPFSYDEKEQKILDFFYQQEQLLANIFYTSYGYKLNEAQKKLFFEIVERPQKGFPFYVIYTYDYRKYHSRLDGAFFVSLTGDRFFYSDYHEEKISFETWLEMQIQGAKKYHQKQLNNPN